MNFPKCLIALSLMLPFLSWCQNADTHVENKDGYLYLSNSLLSLKISLSDAVYSVTDKKDNTIVLDNARLSSDGWNSPQTRFSTKFKSPKITWIQKAVNQSNKNGQRIEISIECTTRQLPEYRYAFTLLDGESYIILQAGINNKLPIASRFTKAELFSEATLFPNADIASATTLNGAAGITMPEVWIDTTNLRQSDNSMLFTAEVNGKRHSIVWGGLHYEYFYATTLYKSDKKTNTRTVSLFMNDPVGRRVSVNQDWWSPDTYYLGIGGSNPFLALEKYGLALREANNAKPNVYDFPTLCGWAVGNLSKGRDINNSAALIGEMDEANKCGLTKYTKVAVRLEPDTYCYKDGNTEQGWWDDEHWSKYGHLVKPYETFAKWCAAVKERNGVPFTYFQSSMPSDDFAKAHPNWMLNNDISQLNLFHRHHLPYVHYDYTNPEFKQYMLAVWQRLHRDGMIGIKFDYAETAWNPAGGFEDSTATTTSAYRQLFSLCRQGLGPEGHIHERCLGENNTPTLDVCAGIVDIQRNAGDNNKFEAQYVTTSGLRWYKARSVFSYYPDSKSVHNHTESVRQALFTMLALTSGRIELATPFEMLTPTMVHEISRIYPMYFGLKSPRPIDAFLGNKNPKVYDLELTKNWHQVALFNGEKTTNEVSVSLNKEMVQGGLALDAAASYYVYDFWKDTFIGKLKGTETISANLDSLSCAMFSVHKVQDVPQLVSTNRHILQGWMELKDVNWNEAEKILSGKASVIGWEAMRIVVASNNWKLTGVKAEGATAKWEKHPAGDALNVLVLESKDTKEVAWKIQYKK